LGDENGSATPAAISELGNDKLLQLIIENNPGTAGQHIWLQYQLSETASLTLDVYKLNGGIIHATSLGTVAPGTHQLKLLGELFEEPGSYIVRLRSGEHQSTTQLIIY
jgi:hypothetical protein